MRSNKLDLASRETKNSCKIHCICSVVGTFLDSMKHLIKGTNSALVHNYILKTATSKRRKPVTFHVELVVCSKSTLSLLELRQNL